MRFMVIVKANAETEAGILPSHDQLAAMGAFNEELVNAGVLLAGEGLHASAKGARIRFPTGAKPVVTDGPFAQTNGLIAGFWLIQVTSKDEAIAWLSRAPFSNDEEIELRQVFETEDFGASPEIVAHEDELRRRVTEAALKA